MIHPERKYPNGTIVLASNLKLRMVIITASLRLAGWKYELGFPRKDGKANKRRETRFLWEKELAPDEKAA